MKGVIAVTVVWFVIWLAAVITALTIAIHFILKLW